MSSRQPNTEDIKELLALTTKQVDPENFLSTQEICELTGKSVDTVRKLLREANKQGLLLAERRTSRRIDGGVVYIPVYRIRKGKSCPR